MIIYWPNKQSIELNYFVVNLFINTKKKFNKNLSNKTQYYLYIDLLNYTYKQKLLYLIIKELENLILNIVEINLCHQSLKLFKQKIINEFLNNIRVSLITEKLHCNEFKSKEYFHINNNKNTLFLNEYILLAENLLTYLIFGASMIEDNIFIFNRFYTPYKHVQILLENFVIQTSHIIIYEILHQLTSLPEILNFLIQNQMCNHAYISARSIALFFNQLYWQNYIEENISLLNSIYSNRYKIWLMSSKGIILKYIYIYRLKYFNHLSMSQNFYLFFLEIKDIAFPKIEQFIIIIAKYILYALVNLMNYIMILITRIIISYIKK